VHGNKALKNIIKVDISTMDGDHRASLKICAKTGDFSIAFKNVG
jgi:hypothetical protein